MKLSVIIPAYNVESYLERCINSVLNQRMPSDDFEIIIVDDGSTDNTYKLAVELAVLHPNVSAYTQPNQGQSGARNKALEKAKGEYVWFVDADDYILPGSIDTLYAIANNKRLDALYFLLQRHYEGEPTAAQHFDCRQTTLPVGEIISGATAVIGGYYPCSSCAAIYRREKLEQEKLRFMPKIFRQDVEFTYRSIPTFDRVMFLQEAYYVYFTHPGSVTTSDVPAIIIRRMSGDGHVAKTCLQLAEKYSDNQELQKAFLRRYQGIMIGVFATMIKHRKKWRQEGINKFLHQRYQELNVYPIIGPSLSWKWHIISGIINNRFLLKLYLL